MFRSFISIGSSRGSTKARQPAMPSSLVPSGVYSTRLLANAPRIHVGVGCDYCGMTPIIGERYRCKDRVEKMGFDLCEACYNNPSNHQISDGDGSDSSEDHGNVHLQAVSSNDIPQDVGNALEGIDDDLLHDEDNFDAHNSPD